jgi:hypothetical protein
MIRLLTKIGVALSLFLVASHFCLGQAKTPLVTQFLTPDEYRRSGLNKLTPDEVVALNAAMFRVFTSLAQKSTLSDRVQSGVSELDLFDSHARATAYISDEDGMTIYLWSGEPVAYLDEDSVYGFNGKHLGWLYKGAVYDHDGNVLAASATRFQGGVPPPGLKSLKDLKPLKGLKELKPLKPLFGSSWSDASSRAFFLQGIN